MTHEYDDPISTEKLDSAARLALRWQSETPAARIEALAAGAVQVVFCTASPMPGMLSSNTRPGSIRR